MEFEGRKRIRQHFDIAPLIDIVFLLLIFFMLTAHFVKQPGIKIILPQATATKSQEEDIVVFISEKNRIYLNDRYIGIEGLEDALKKRLEVSQKKVVIIRADKRIDLGFAVVIMDTAKGAGAMDLVISTQKPPER